MLALHVYKAMKKLSDDYPDNFVVIWQVMNESS